MFNASSQRKPGPDGDVSIRFLGMSGSLRDASSNTSLLRAAQMLAGPGLIIDLYDGLGDLPHFNPDLESGRAPLPAPVTNLRRWVAAADGLILSCPEYAHGLPGAFKNALDWLVGSPDFSGTPVVLFNASSRAHHAQAALRLTLKAMSATLIEGASITIPLAGKTASPLEIASDPAFAFAIVDALDVLVGAVLAPDVIQI
jgi:chromate reductase